MIYQVVGLLGVPLFESFSWRSCELFCKKHDLDPTVSIVPKEVSK